MYLALRVQERPTSLLKEALGVIDNGLHDLGPVQRLDSFCVLDVTRADDRNDKDSLLIHTHTRFTRRADLLLEPLLDGVERVDGDGIDHRHLLAVVLVNDDHVKVLQVELHTLKVDQLHLV